MGFVKKCFGVLVISLFFLSNFGFSKNVLAEKTQLIHGVVPTKVTAKLHQEYPDAAGKPVITDDSWEFWNVGALGGDKYSVAKLTIDTTTMTWDGASGEVPVTNSSIWEGTFGGGPNGNFNVVSKGYSINTQLNNGQAVVYKNGKSASVDNPQVFSGWKDEEVAATNQPKEVDQTKTVSPAENDQTSEPTTFNEKTAEDIFNAKPEGLLDNNEVTITKIIGEVEVSDPSVRRGLWGKTWQALGTVFTEERNPEAWRTWVDPVKGMKLSDGFQLKTGSGRAVVQFKDGTKFIIMQDSTITFTASGIKMDNGSVIYDFKKIGKKIYIYNKTSKFGIIGTQFVVNSGPMATQLRVFEGIVAAQSLVDNKIEEVKAGEKVMMDNNGFKGKVVSDDGGKIDITKIENDIIQSENDSARSWGWIAVVGLVLVVGGVLVFLVILLILFRRKR